MSLGPPVAPFRAVSSSLPAEMAQVVAPSPDIDHAPLLLREPYRLMFPIGAALAFAGIGHWVLHAVGVLEDYRPIFHAMTQIQGFLMAFAVGFLFTMIPRRTGSAPPSVFTLTVGALAPIGVSVFAWHRAWMLSQLCWFVLAFTVVGFVVRRFSNRRSTRRPPNSFVWIPVAFLLGVAGSLLTAVGAASGGQWWLHDLGRGFVLQGMFVALVLGVGGLALPLMTRGEAPADADDSTDHRRARALHLLAAATLVASFFLEQWVSLRAGLAVRGSVVAATLLMSAELAVPPSKPGAVRRLVWVSAWMLPLGFMLGAIFDDHAKAFLHVAFIGGLATLALAVSTQVTLGHGGFSSLLGGRPWAVVAIGAFALLALGPRIAMSIDPDRFFLWMGVAAALFIAALVSWVVFVVPKLARPSA